MPSEDDTPGFGFTNSAIWVRFQARNEAEQAIPWLLVVDSNLFYIDANVPTANGQGYDLMQTGTARPYNSRAIDHPRFLFSLSIPPGEDQIIYVRFESESAMNLSLAIWSASSAHIYPLILIRGLAVKSKWSGKCKGRRKRMSEKGNKSVAAVKYHLSNIFSKLAVSNRTEAATFALETRPCK